MAESLGAWAASLQPSAADLELARLALVDTVAVAVAGRAEPVARIAAREGDPTYWATAAHALDYDDLHLPSTAHISAVCVTAALAAGGEDAAYLAGAGVMARLGAALGWQHYSRGWHATCTAGAPAAAVAAGVAMGLDGARLATAMALALPAAGGVQRAFGTMAKPLQVGFAVAGGLRAARLAAAGASADPTAVEEWMALLGSDAAAIDPAGPAIPGGLAIKLYPCCYALQRPISALAGLEIDPEAIESIRVETPAAALQPLNRHDPTTGLEGKFSLEYGIAAALLDAPVNFASFTDAAVQRPAAGRLQRAVAVTGLRGGAGLLDGSFSARLTAAGREHVVELDLPPGAPERPPTRDQLRGKVEDCCGHLAGEVMDLSWPAAAAFLRRTLR